MHSINDIYIFLKYYKDNNLKITKDHFLEAICCVETYEEFKMVFNLFTESGLKTGVRFFDYLVNYICDYKDCRKILDYLIMYSSKVNPRYFIQLILLSSSEDDARDILSEARNLNVEIAESWIDRVGDEELVLKSFKESIMVDYKIRGFRFLPHVEDIRKAISYLSKEELKNSARKASSNYKKTSYLRTEFVRDEYVKVFALKSSNGICQLCEENAPFYNKKGEPFLEVHHINYLSNGGKDEIENVIALCPNCHRKVHILENEEDYLKLKKKAKFLVNL